MCAGGSGPEPWGGDRSDSEASVQAGQHIDCDGSRLAVVHAPTNTVLYERSL